MDTSKEYILMCEKAVEVQGQHKKDELDIFFCRGCVKTIASKLPGCKGLDHVIERVDFKYVSDIRPKEWNDYCIWLPRQDQLQGMVEKHERQGHIEQRFHEFCKSLPEYDKNRIYYLNLGWSMEQLWLACVMKEKFNKTWDGKNWILQSQ